MRTKNKMALWILLLVGAVAAGGYLNTAGAQDLKTRMKERLPVILEMKARGVIGENYQGYLEFVGGQQENADLVAAENSDRRTVYAAIARQQNTSAETVGVRRALQIAEKANPGEWLQSADGKWYQK